MELVRLLFFIFCSTNSFVETKEFHTDIHLTEGNENVFKIIFDKIDMLENKVAEYAKALSTMESTCDRKIDNLNNEYSMKTTAFQSAVLSSLHDKKSPNMAQEDEFRSNGEQMADKRIEAIGVTQNGRTENDSLPDNRVEIQYGHQGRSSQVTNHHIVRRTESESKVAFFAKLTNHSHHLGANQNILFDDVVTNYGNAYDNRIGVFRVPVSGAYVISTSITTYSRSNGHYGIYINKNVESWFFINGKENEWDESSQTIIVHLTKGDDVTIRSMDSDTDITGVQNSIFSGFLLFQDEDTAIVVG